MTKMKNQKIISKKVWSICAITSLLLMQTQSYSQDAETPKEEEPIGYFEKLNTALKSGKPIFNAKLRYEYAEVGSLDEANALTLRTRVGYETGAFYNFKVLVDAENTTSIIPDHNYSAPGQIVPGKSIIADPEGSEINQAFLSYQNYDTVLRFGRQRIVYDNARFIGNVVWRQAEQTFDAISLTNNSIDDWYLQYAYLSQINRIFFTAWDSDSHIANLSYTGIDNVKFVTYAYLLSFDSSPVNSADTYGGYVDGNFTVFDDILVKYRGEYAYQMDGRNSPLSYDANYYHLKLTGTKKNFTVGGGYEVLGSDGGAAGFRTPLATLHAFNGWADNFLATPATGIQDIYALVGYKYKKMNATALYHDLSSDDGDTKFGDEFNFVVTYKINDNWSALVKYANFMSDSTFPDVQRVWLQLIFNL